MRIVRHNKGMTAHNQERTPLSFKDVFFINKGHENQREELCIVNSEPSLLDNCTVGTDILELVDEKTSTRILAKLCFSCL